MLWLLAAQVLSGAAKKNEEALTARLAEYKDQLGTMVAQGGDQIKSQIEALKGDPKAVPADTATAQEIDTRRLGHA